MKINKFVAVSLLLSMLVMIFPVFTMATDEIIVSPGKEGFFKSGVWLEASVPNYDGGKCLYATGAGASVAYAPTFAKSGSYKVYIWRAFHKESAVQEYTVLYSGKTDKKSVNFAEGEPGWVEIGTYDFTGDGKEGITHTHSSSQAFTSRIGSVKFELVGEGKPIAKPSPGQNLIGSATSAAPTSAATAVPAGSSEANAVPVDNSTQKDEIIIKCAGEPYSETGQWADSSAVKNYDGSSTRWISSPGASFKLMLKVPKSGNYKVYFYRSVHPNTTTKQSFEVTHSGKTSITTPVDGSKGDSGWQLLGIYDFSATGEEFVTSTCAVANHRATGFKLVPTTENITPAATPTPKPEKTPEDDVIDVEPVGTFSFEGEWQWSGALSSPIKSERETMWVAGKAGATCTYNPELEVAGKVRVCIYKLWYPTLQDTKVRYDVVYGDKTDTVYIDLSEGTASEWITLGTYDFSGTGEEYVKLTRETDDEKTNTRAGTVRFEILNSADATGNSIWQTVYVNPNKDKIDRQRLASLDKFTDMVGHWANYDVEYMAELGYINGKAEGVFSPDDTITRAEFISILARALNLEAAKINAYSDVYQDSWYAGTIGAAKSAGLLEGLPNDGNFYPDQAITREEIALFINNAITNAKKNLEWLDALDNPFGKFTDKDSLSPWSKEALERVIHMGIMKGVTETTLNGKANADRSQAAVMLKRFMETVIWSCVSADEWVLTFQDEFEAGPTLDWTVWQSESGAPGHILSSRFPENTVVEDGMLKLLTKKESKLGKEWTTASVWVNPTVFAQSHGYWEARYRYTKAKGINNAWWMMTKGGGKTTPESFEIDINEGHYPNIVNMTYHTGKNEKGEAGSHSKRYLSAFDLSYDFHTYAVEWTENEIIFYHDGQEIERKSHVNAQKPVTPWFSTAVLNWAGMIGEEADGTSMDVQWVRVYQKK